MKKSLFILLLSILFIPVVFAKNTVEITKVELDSKSESAIINNEPTFDGLVINCDIGFVNKGDFVKYKATIKNTYNEDFSIAEKEEFDERKSIKYSFEVNDLLKANDTIDVYVTISYENEIDDDLFVNGKYNEKNKIVIELLNGANETFNPNTSSKSTMFIVFGVSLLLLVVSTTLLIKKRSLKGLPLLLLIAAPIIAKAIEEITITVNVNVDIIKNYKVVYKYGYNEIKKATEVDANYTEGKNCSTYYDGTVAEENKYYSCKKILLYQDPKLYVPGETVNVFFPTYTIVYNRYVWVNGEHVGYCNYNSDAGAYVCPEGIRFEDYTLKYLEYNKREIVEEGFTYKDDDPEVMKFMLGDDNPYMDQGLYQEGILDNWSRNGRFSIDETKTFTMPEHDVFINEYFPVD